MKKSKIFIACDSTNIKKINEIIKKTENSKLQVGYKFGLEFLNSKNGRNFIYKLKDKITFGDYKFSDIPNTCASAIRAVKDLNFNYLTIHINCGFDALKAAKEVSGKTKLFKCATNRRGVFRRGFWKTPKRIFGPQKPRRRLPPSFSSSSSAVFFGEGLLLLLEFDSRDDCPKFGN